MKSNVAGVGGTGWQPDTGATRKRGREAFWGSVSVALVDGEGQVKPVERSDDERMGDPESGRGVAFPSTNWNDFRQILEGGAAESREVLNRFVGGYVRPLLSYFCSLGLQSADAADMTQGLLLQLLERDSWRQVELESNLRRWLLRAAKNYYRDQYRRQTTQRRSPESPLQSLDSLLAAQDGWAPSVCEDPAEAYLCEWRFELLDRAMKALGAQSAREGTLRDFELFREYYLERCASSSEDREDELTWDRLADKHGYSEGRQASARAFRMKRKLGDCIRSEIRLYVQSEEEVKRELRELLL